MNSDARARKLRAVAWWFVLVESGIILCRFRASLVFGLTTRRLRDLIWFRARDRVAGRRAGLTNAVEHRTRWLSFSFSWRTPSNHVLASTQFFGSLAMLAPAEIHCQCKSQRGKRCRPLRELTRFITRDPRACALGFMLTPASQAKNWYSWFAG
jgi:hypothetical protein